MSTTIRTRLDAHLRTRWQPGRQELADDGKCVADDLIDELLAVPEAWRRSPVSAPDARA